jgi:peptide deformylase
LSQTLEFDLTLYPAAVLRQVAEPITAFDGALADTVKAMFERMRASKGVGLAAPQVGLKQRILVLNDTGEPESDLVLINPTIVERSGPKEDMEEGCLSFPGIYAAVTRPTRCTVEYQDLDGRSHRQEFDGFVSRIIQHEYDHLEGVLLVDRMSSADKLRHKGALEDLIESHRRRKRAPQGE